MIRVGVLGAAGRMGRQVCTAVEDDSDLALVAAIDPAAGGQRIGSLIGHPENGVTISEELDTLLQAEVEVCVDFTRPVSMPLRTSSTTRSCSRLPEAATTKLAGL